VARVIRGEGAQVVPAEVVDAKAEAARIVKEAEARAQQIAEASRAQLLSDARVAARAELAAQLVALERERRAAVEGVEGSVGELALGVARRTRPSRGSVARAR
jgi:F0F1-type ATP synthase membrane subunit b/b'